MTIIRRFDVEVGTCACCGRQVQGRHPLQTSDSLRVGEVQVGPEALSMAAVQRVGAVARTDGAGVGTRVWVEVEPQWGVPGVGATGESGGTHLPATTKNVTAKPRGMAGRHGLESGSTPAKSAGFVEPTGHRLCH